jgi:hypothetical protein
MLVMYSYKLIGNSIEVYTNLITTFGDNSEERKIIGTLLNH